MLDLSKQCRQYIKYIVIFNNICPVTSELSKTNFLPLDNLNICYSNTVYFNPFQLSSLTYLSKKAEVMCMGPGGGGGGG